MKSYAVTKAKELELGELNKNKNMKYLYVMLICSCLVNIYLAHLTNKMKNYVVESEKYVSGAMKRDSINLITAKEIQRQSIKMDSTIKATAKNNLELLCIYIKNGCLDYNYDVMQMTMSQYALSGNKLDHNWLMYQEKLINSIKHKR